MLRPLPLSQGPKADSALPVPGSQLRTIAGGRGGGGLSGPHASSCLEKLQKPNNEWHSLQQQQEQSQRHRWHSGGGNPLSLPRPDSGGGNPLSLWRPLPGTATPLRHVAAAAAATSPSVSGLHTEARVARDARFSSLEDRDLAVFREVVGAAGVVEDPEALEPYNRCVCVVVGGGTTEMGVKGRWTPPTCYGTPEPCRVVRTYVAHPHLCRDWMKKYQGASRLLLRPTTTEQVSRIIAHCHARSLAVVPQVGCGKCGHEGIRYVLHQMSINCK